MAGSNTQGGRVVAVTGPRSFYGRRALRRLASEPGVARIVAVDVREPEGAPEKVAFEKLDLARPGADGELAAILASAGADTLLHAAFLARPVQNRVFAHDLEVIGTLHALNAAAAAGVRKVVVTSTTAVYGPRRDNPNFLGEDAPLHANPRSPFVADKVEAEHAVRAFAESNPACVVSVLRFATPVGPSVRNIATAYLRRRAAPRLLGFDPLIQVIHEDDAEEALALALARDVNGPINVASRAPLPLSTLLKLSGTLAIPLPHPVARFALDALYTAGLAPMSGDLLGFLRYLCVADTSRADKLLGFKPRYSSRDAVLAMRGEGRRRPALAGGGTEATA